MIAVAGSWIGRESLFLNVMLVVNDLKMAMSIVWTDLLETHKYYEKWWNASSDMNQMKIIALWLLQQIF